VKCSRPVNCAMPAAGGQVPGLGGEELGHVVRYDSERPLVPEQITTPQHEEGLAGPLNEVPDGSLGVVGVIGLGHRPSPRVAGSLTHAF
jgi:hypothetical protein